MPARTVVVIAVVVIVRFLFDSVMCDFPTLTGTRQTAADVLKDSQWILVAIQEQLSSCSLAGRRGELHGQPRDIDEV
jgi:hypothetical protein